MGMYRMKAWGQLGLSAAFWGMKVTRVMLWMMRRSRCLERASRAASGAGVLRSLRFCGGMGIRCERGEVLVRQLIEYWRI